MFKNLLRSFVVKISLLAVLLITSILGRSYGQTTLVPGDIAFISIEMSGSPDDYFEFVTLVNLWPCTIVNFTDNMYKTGGTFCTDEFSVGFTVTQKIPAGTIVRYTCSAIPGAFTMSAGAAIPVNNGAGSNNGLSSSDDNVTCYQGTLNSGQVNIAAIHNNAFTTPNSCGNSNTSALPAGLTLGTNAVQTGSTNDNRRYNCAVTSGTKAALATAINTPGNWQNGAPSSCSFTVTSVASCSGGPTNPPNSFSCTGTTPTTSTFKWDRCDDMEVTVVARKTADAATDPTNGVNYTPNSVYGSGSALGLGYVVYEGTLSTPSTLTVTNLLPNTSYSFDIYTYYSTSGICFNATQLTGTCVTALPIELLYFNINKKNNLTLFEWATASEIRNDHFEIEASKDGISFVSIGKVGGSGSSQNTEQYNFSSIYDKEFNYFRLKQTDYNGEFKYSTIETLASEEVTEYEIFPVPTSEVLFTKIKNTEEIKITVWDIVGKELPAIVSKTDNNVLSLDVKGIPTGTYMLVITSDDKIISKRFYKE
jgi:hypothetical protein